MITKLGEEIICNRSGFINEKKIKDEIIKIIESVEPLIVPDGTNLCSAGIKIACEILNDRLQLKIDMKKYPNSFLCNSNDLIKKQKVKEALKMERIRTNGGGYCGNKYIINKKIRNNLKKEILKKLGLDK